MARLPDFGEVEGVPCDQCGEVSGVVHLAEVSLCDDCFEPQVADVLEAMFGRRVCGVILWPDSDNPALCLLPVGHGFHE